jgi:hypothetical protein
MRINRLSVDSRCCATLTGYPVSLPVSDVPSGTGPTSLCLRAEDLQVSKARSPLTDNWDWQTQAACRGMDIAVFFHPPDERNAASRQRRPFATRAPPLRPDREHARHAREPY